MTINTVVCLGTRETLEGPYGIGHAIIAAVTGEKIPTNNPPLVADTLELTRVGLLYTHDEKKLTVVPGVPSLFLGTTKEVKDRASALATQLQEKITQEEGPQQFFMYGYSRGCLVLLQALQELEQHLTQTPHTLPQIHVVLNDPVAGGIALQEKDKRLPKFVSTAEIIYPTNEERVFHEAVTGIYSSTEETKTRITFLNGNHTSATRVPLCEIDFKSHTVDKITRLVQNTMQELGQAVELQVFAMMQKDKPALARAIRDFTEEDEVSRHKKSAATLREESSFFVRNLPKSSRFVPEGALKPYQNQILHDFPRELYLLKERIHTTLTTLNAQAETSALKKQKASLNHLSLICQKMSNLRQHIEEAKNSENQRLICQNFTTCLNALQGLSNNAIAAEDFNPQHLEKLSQTLNTIAKEAKHHSAIRRCTLLISKIVASLLIPPLGLFMAYQGMFNCKTKTTLLAEKINTDVEALSQQL